jgi:hypothetical protein
LNAVVERHEPVVLPATAGPLDRVADLMARGVTVEQLDKFLDVQHKYEAEQARRLYVKAMAAFKSEPLPRIVKKKPVKQRLKNKQTGEYSGAEINYKHETLAQVVNAAVAALAKHGLSHSWDVTQANRVITVSCVMTHEAGHSERRTLEGLPDESGQKNPLQQIRSTITFLQRATLLLITGLAPEDGSDDDSRGAYPEASVEPAPERRATGFATAKQQALIKKRARSDEALASALADIGVNTTEQIPFDKVNDVLAALEK